MIDLSQDIQSLSTFKRNTNEMIEQIKIKGNALVLTVNGKAQIVVQDVEAYQKLLDKIARLETLTNQRQPLNPNRLQTFDGAEISSSSDILDLYGAAADVEFVLNEDETCHENKT